MRTLRPESWGTEFGPEQPASRLLEDGRVPLTAARCLLSGGSLGPGGVCGDQGSGQVTMGADLPSLTAQSGHAPPPLCSDLQQGSHGPRGQMFPGGVRWGERAPDIPVSSASKQNPWRPPAPLRRWEANLSPCFGSTWKCVSWSLFCSRRSCQLVPRGSWGQGQTRGQGVVPTGEGGPARLPVTLPPAPRRSAGSPRCSPRAAFCTVLESGTEDLPPVCLSCHCVWL